MTPPEPPDDARVLEALFRLHQGLPRQGPGTDEATAAALRGVPGGGRDARILDIGCGEGRQTAVLARASPERLVAVDVFPGFLEAAPPAVPDALFCQASMTALPFTDAGFDLIWCEGAAYIMGFAEALRAWRPLLRAGGHLVASECCWLTDAPPPEARAFWTAAYPAMATVAESAARAAAAGYAVVATMTLPPEGWWQGYYEPLMERMEHLAPAAQGDEALRAVMAETQREIALFRRHGSSYGYVFFVLRRGPEEA